MSYTKECTSVVQFINEFPEAYAQFIETTEITPDDDCYDINDFGELQSLLSECGDWGDEEVSSCWISREITMNSNNGKWQYVMGSNSYRKDQLICDAKYGDAIYIIDLREKELADAKKNLEKQAANTKKWMTLFDSMPNIWALQGELLKHKFPKKLQ